MVGTHDFAPHGNDTGADVLAFYRKWRTKNTHTDSTVFFRSLMEQWEVTVPPDPTDEYSTHTYEEAIVGLAFAELKLHACCSPEVADEALHTLARQRDLDPPDHWNSETRDLKTHAVGAMIRILKDSQN